MILLHQTGACRRGFRRLAAATFLLFACAGWQTSADAQSAEEARAIFLFNFAKFVEWPETAFADAATPVTIAVVGDANVARALERYVKGKNANGRDIIVKKLDGADGSADCHIVFVGDKRHVTAVIELTSGKPILSVGDDENFLKSGGTIRLFAQDSKVMCAINVKAADAAGLKLGEKLVKAAS